MSGIATAPAVEEKERIQHEMGNISSQFDEIVPLEDEMLPAEIEELQHLDLPAEDGIPMESNWHRIEMNLLIDSIHVHWHERSDYFTGGNMFIYFSREQIRRKSYRGPDFFVVKDVDGTKNRDSWIVWNEDGRYPDVIVELASPSTANTDLGLKKELYQHTFHTTEYFCYDPQTQQLQGWRLSDGRYHDIVANDREWLWSQELGIWLGTWEGEFQRVQATWLRFYSIEETLVLTIAEAALQQAESERQRAERLVEQLRALGVEPDQI